MFSVAARSTFFLGGMMANYALIVKIKQPIVCR